MQNKAAKIKQNKTKKTHKIKNTITPSSLKNNMNKIVRQTISSGNI